MPGYWLVIIVILESNCPLGMQLYRDFSLTLKLVIIRDAYETFTFSNKMQKTTFCEHFYVFTRIFTKFFLQFAKSSLRFTCRNACFVQRYTFRYHALDHAPRCVICTVGHNFNYGQPARNLLTLIARCSRIGCFSPFISENPISVVRFLDATSQNFDNLREEVDCCCPEQPHRATLDGVAFVLRVDWRSIV